MSGRVSVITSSEVTVVRVHDGVLLSLLHVFAVPLADARAASVGQHGASELSERLSLECNGKVIS